MLTAYYKLQFTSNANQQNKDCLLNEIAYQLTDFNGKNICFGMVTSHVISNEIYHNISLKKALQWIWNPKKPTDAEIKFFDMMSDIKKENPLKFEKFSPKQINRFETLTKKIANVKQYNKEYKEIYADLESKSEKDNTTCIKKNDKNELFFNLEGFRKFCLDSRWVKLNNRILNAILKTNNLKY
jgi:hypothetical protein